MPVLPALCQRKDALRIILHAKDFFGRLKNEMFYGRDWNHASIDSFIHKLDEYIHWYNETRIKISLGGMSPFQYRRSLGIAI